MTYAGRVRFGTVRAFSSGSRTEGGGGVVSFVKLTASDPLEHSGLITCDHVVLKSVPLEPLEHSVPEAPQSRGDGLVSDMPVVIAYASRSLHLSQRRYCTTHREMLAAVVMCTHFRSYLRGVQFTLRTDHSSLRWLQRFRIEDGMLARWYLLLGQFSVTVQTYVASCTACLAWKSPCPRRAHMGHVAVGRRWERVAMDLLDLSITSAKGNRYVLVMVDCFSRWTEACPLPDKTAVSVADAFFSNIVCRFGMPSVIHSDQGR